MTPEEISSKLLSRIEYMLLQYHPRPTCVTKFKQHEAEREEIKRQIAAKLQPQGLGLTVTVSP